MAKHSKSKKNSKKSKGVSKKKKQPKGTVIAGFLQSKNRYRFHSLLPGTLPRVGAKDLKFFDVNLKQDDNIVQSGTTSMGVAVMEVVSDGSGDTNGILQNNTVNGRIGTRIYPKLLQVKGQVGYPRMNASEVGEDMSPMGQGLARILVVVDKQSNQGLLAIGDVLASGNGTAITKRQFNYANLQRFDVLCDKTITVLAQQSILDPSSGQAVGQQSFTMVDFEVPLKDTIKYADASATGLFGSIVTNNIYMYIGMNQVPITGVEVGDDLGFWALNLSTRFLYTD